MNASGVDAPATGLGNALKKEELQNAGLEVVEEFFSAIPPPYLMKCVTAAVSLVIVPGAVTLSSSATTVGKVATWPKAVLNVSEKEGSAVTFVANQAIWLAIVSIKKSRSATFVAKVVTFRKTAPKSSATGVARPAIWPATAAGRPRSIATAVASLDI